jgi:hypothetical protein
VVALLAYLPGSPPPVPLLGGALAVLIAAALPAGWTVAALGVVGWLALNGRAGIATLVAAGALPAIVLLRRPALRSTPVLACLLGAVGLAGAFPALAGQALRWRHRALLAALGYWWLVLAEVAGARALWLGAPPTAWRPSAFAGSPSAAVAHALLPLATPATAAGALMFALGALALPWVVRGERASLDAVRAVAWAFAVTVASATAVAALGGSAPGAGMPANWELGALAGAALAVIARGVRLPGRR